MLKLVRGPTPSIVGSQRDLLDEPKCLPFSEQFETIQNQAKLEIIGEKSQHPVETLTLADIKPRDITPEMYPSLRDFKRNHSKSTS